MQRKLYAIIASKLQAIRNCDATGNIEWFYKHREAARELVRDHMPSGSGIDNGTTFDDRNSMPNKLVFITAYHHMNEGGYYDGWTEHTVIVTPDLASGFDLKITGSNRNEIKDYLSDVYSVALNTVIEEYPAATVAA